MTASDLWRSSVGNRALKTEIVDKEKALYVEATVSVWADEHEQTETALSDVIPPTTSSTQLPAALEVAEKQALRRAIDRLNTP